MYFTAIAALLLPILNARLAKSFPTHNLANITARGGITSTYCAYPQTYQLSTIPTLMYENPVLMTGITVGPDPSGAEITAGYTYMVGRTFTGGITGGLNFDLEQVASQASGQVSLSFGVTVTKGAQVSATIICPPNIVCGLTAAAQYLHVEGTQTMHYCGWDGSIDPDTYPCEFSPNSQCDYPNVQSDVPYPYVANFPVKFGNSLVDGQDSVVTAFNACAMGYPDGGLPQCPSGTEVPPGMTCNIQGCTTQTCQAMCANLGVPEPSPTCQWSPALSCSWCNCQPYFWRGSGSSSS